MGIGGIPSKLRAEWYVFYTKVEMARIGANCLGNAITVAEEMASRCNLSLIGVTPDLGVTELGQEKPPTSAVGGHTVTSRLP